MVQNNAEKTQKKRKKEQVSNKNNCIFEYYDAISSGKIIAGKLILKTYKMLTELIGSGVYVFDAEKAETAINFIETFAVHSKGRKDNLKLELWQKAMISAIFGIVGQDGFRVYSEVFTVIGRKNGKSLLMAAILLDLTFIDSEYGKELYIIASKKDQAGHVYNAFAAMVERNESLSSRCRKTSNGYFYEENNTTIISLPSGESGLNGPNPSCVICDEVAVWPGQKGLAQYNAIQSAVGSREQPLVLNITTAGYENGVIYDDLFERSIKVLNGESKDKRLLPFIYQIDDELLWDDIDELKKANPNLGVSLRKSFIEEYIEKAKNNITAKNEFLTKFCNIKGTGINSWFNFDDIKKCECTLDISFFKDCVATAGFDLSISNDLTAVCVPIIKDETTYCLSKFFIPKNVYEKNRHLYGANDILVEKGVIAFSGENHIEDGDAVNWLCELRDEYGIQFLTAGYDRWRAENVEKLLKYNGFDKAEDVRQDFNLTGTCFELDKLVKDGKFKIVNSPILAQHFHNVCLEFKPSGDACRPVKRKGSAKIDGVSAVLCALALRRKYWEQYGDYFLN